MKKKKVTRFAPGDLFVLKMDAIVNMVNENGRVAAAGDVFTVLSSIRSTPNDCFCVTMLSHTGTLVVDYWFEKTSYLERICRPRA